MPLTAQALATARARLEEDLAEVEKELHDLGSIAEGGVEMTFDEGFADAAQSTSERAKVFSIVDGLHERLEELRAALGRIDKGTYGICERCGQEIGAERLEAIPSARLCITCKSKG